MKRQLIPSSSPYAKILGFSRAVRVDDYVVVGGTAPIDAEGKTIGVGNPEVQARVCLETIKAALEESGASLSDVVRTRVFLRNISDWNVVAKVRGEYFKEIKPVDTVMEVNSFINPEWLLEIEADAILNSKSELAEPVAGGNAVH